MTDTPQVAAARVEVGRTRSRLMGTAHALQDRLSPKTLARSTWQGAKEKGADLAEDAVDAVRARPIATGGVIAALTLFLAREPLMDLARGLLDGAKDKRRARKSRKQQQDREEVR